MPPKDEAYLKVQVYLEKHKKRLQEQNVDFITWELKTFVPETKEIPDNELRATAAVWRSLHGPIFPLSTRPPLTLPDSKIVETIKGAVKTVIKGVDLSRTPNGRLHIGIEGLTSELSKGDTTVTATRSWGGALKVEVKKGDLHINGVLATDEWSVSVSYPEDTFAPTADNLGKLVSEAEKAMRGSYKALGGFDNILDQKKVEDAIAPAIKPLSDAAEAVQSTAKVPRKGGVSIGGKIGNPPAMPGETGRPSGVQVVIVLTITF